MVVRTGKRCPDPVLFLGRIFSYYTVLSFVFAGLRPCFCFCKINRKIFYFFIAKCLRVNSETRIFEVTKYKDDEKDKIKGSPYRPPNQSEFRNVGTSSKSSLGDRKT